MDANERSAAKRKLAELIDRYNKTLCGQKDISEETVRVWLNEFLMIFGWDVQNTDQVLQERKLQGAEYERLKKINSPHRRPDYILVNGTNIKSFLDAKNLTVDIFSSDEAAYQIRSYGWSAKVPCAFVSNFAQLVIYDTRFIPEIDQPANYGVIQLQVDEYIDKFDIIFDHLWHDYVCANKLEEIYRITAIEGRSQVDSQFMNVLTQARLKIAQNLYMLNKALIVNNDALNYYVQVILDRLVFIRVCESKGIETQEKLRRFAQSNNGFWNEFKSSCYMEFYAHYDGAMFSRDENFQHLELSDEILCGFIEKLYYPYPYRFDVIPIKVIANIYEEFLGKQLVISDGNIREITKEEYIRTNGAVATPEHIVDMICRQTVDLSEVSSIDELFNIKILDPCCESGVFIVSCYELLSTAMIRILSENIEERNKYPNYYCEFNGQILLTIMARRAIVVNCIHGIDCDEAAVEVTKMSLALKIVDGNNPVAWSGIGAFGDRILREIDQNIKLGNSLVDVDATFTPSQVIDIKPFNIRENFRTVFESNGGFSYIIGNPPYVETKHYKAVQPAMHEYLRERFCSFEGKADLAVLFIEKSLSLLNSTGRIGFIIQRRWFKTDYGKPTRLLINNGKHLKRLIDFKATDIFKGRMVYASIMILDNSNNDSVQYYRVTEDAVGIKSLFENCSDSGMFAGCEFTTIPRQEGSGNWNFEQYEISQLVSRYRDKWGTFSEFPHLQIKDGIQALWKKVYHIRDAHFEAEYVIGKNGFGETVKVESDMVRGVIYNREFYPFKKVEPEAYCIFPYEGASNTAILYSDLKNRYPFAYEYLRSNEQRIKNNVKCRNGELWHTFTREHNHTMYFVDKIIIPMTARDTIATYMPNSGLYMDNANVWFVSIPGADSKMMKAITCIINSTIFSVFGKAGANPQAGGYYKFNKQFLAPIPFPSYKLNTSSKVTELADLYDVIADLQERYIAATPTMKTVISDTLNEMWSRIDVICYQLYEVSAHEIDQIEAVGRTVSRIELLGGMNL